jgi:thioredoxin reductase (NADPH)
MNLSLNTSSQAQSKETREVKLLILGSGPAGLAAALYAARAELKPVILTGMQIGGQAALTATIENYPGFPDGINGTELGDIFQKHAEKFGAHFEIDVAESVDLSKKPFVIHAQNADYIADALIISTGAKLKTLNIPGEATFVGKGVSFCATCDGWFFKGKEVAVAGGGDSAIEEATFLTHFASKVTVVHRRDTLRAGPILVKRAMENPKVNFIWDSIVEEIIGDQKVKSIKILNLKTKAYSVLKTDGIFIFIGNNPNSEIFKGQLALDENGYIVTDKMMQTSVEGVFAAGEISDPSFRQVVTSAGMGAAAAIQATRFLESK